MLHVGTALQLIILTRSHHGAVPAFTIVSTHDTDLYHFISCKLCHVQSWSGLLFLAVIHNLPVDIDMSMSLPTAISAMCLLRQMLLAGAHILSGNVLEPHALTELLPNWKEEGAPVTVPATEDRFFVLSANRAFRIPTPKQMHNKGNFVISLG